MTFTDTDLTEMRRYLPYIFLFILIFNPKSSFFDNIVNKLQGNLVFFMLKISGRKGTFILYLCGYRGKDKRN